jgi:hypothetical protein
MSFAPILYHFPGLQKPQQIPDAYQERLCGKRAKPSRAGGIPQGPSKKTGLLVCPISNAGHIGYFPERQTWDEVEEGVWIGIDRDFSPADFRNGETLNWYHTITMGDDREWAIPILNPDSPNLSLPTCDKLLMGEWHTVVKPPYTHLVSKCQEIIGHISEAVANQDDTGLTIDDTVARPIIAAAICHYYTLTFQELSCIGIFAPNAYFPAIAAIIDLEAVAAAIKGARMEAGGELNPTDGPLASSLIPAGDADQDSPDTTPSTNPPSSTSTSKQTTEAA